MSRIAIDIVLLPEESAMDAVIQANRRLLEDDPGQIVLDKQNCLPHVSLAMGCLDQADIRRAGEALAEVAAKQSIGTLRAIGIYTAHHGDGRKVSSLAIERDPHIVSLHEAIMDRFEPLLSYDVWPEMLVHPDEVAESSLQWIANYRDQSSFDNFFPHITLGYGTCGVVPVPRDIAASKLAICHLGNHCTCRRVLAAIDLSDSS